LAYAAPAVLAADSAAMVNPDSSSGVTTPVAGLDKAGMDAAARPQDNLFEAMNGNWLKAADIPADKPEYGTFIILRDLSDKRVREIVDELAARPQPAGTVDAKIADFYNAYMDTAAMDKAGVAPMKPYFAQIDAARDKHALIALMGKW